LTVSPVCVHVVVFEGRAPDKSDPRAEKTRISYSLLALSFHDHVIVPVVRAKTEIPSGGSGRAGVVCVEIVAP
jgi:hypothetical protein